MEWERSSGAVVFTRQKDQLLFVLVQERSGAYSFPKGHIEGDETEQEAACREIFEETGLRPDFLPGFNITDVYHLSERPGTWKRVTYFLAEFKDQTPVFQQDELQAVQLVSYERAMRLFQHENNRKVLETAYAYLTDA